MPMASLSKALKLKPPMSGDFPSESSVNGGGDIEAKGGGEHETMGGTNFVPSISIPKALGPDKQH